jgi:hypothetical protein
MDKPIRVPGIDVEIQLVFQPEHLNLLLPHFDKVGVTQAHLDDMINAYIASGEHMPYARWILEYGQSILNPFMNQYLKRPPANPTFNRMLLFALKDVIEAHPLISHFRKSKDLQSPKTEDNVK